MECRIVVAVLVLLTVARSAVLLLFEGSGFDSDQALIGLMAKHLIEGRTFPVFTYGQSYTLGVEAWMAAPFLWLGGVTVPMLKLPLVLVNIAITVLLVRALERWGGLRPALAAIPALFFALAPPGTAMVLLDFSGGSVEPFLIVVLVWLLRRRPLWCGAVLSLGVLQREFAIYAGGALLLLGLFNGSWRTRGAWRALALGALSFATVWQATFLAKQFSSIDGPGTSAVWSEAAGAANLSTLTKFVCIDAGQILTGLKSVFTTHSASLLGASHQSLSEFGVYSTLSQGQPWMWPLVGSGFLVMIGRLAWLMYRRALRPWHQPQEFATYLWLVGLQALAVYALMRCGEVQVGTMRYALLALFAPIGLVAGYLAAETSRIFRRLAVALVLVWAGSTAVDHVRLASQYMFDRPIYAHRVLADRLVADGIEVAIADYWDSLSTVYLSGEQVIIASTSAVFLEEYQWIVEERREDAVWIKREACEGGRHVIDALYLCPPPLPPLRRGTERTRR